MGVQDPESDGRREGWSGSLEGDLISRKDAEIAELKRLICEVLDNSMDDDVDEQVLHDMHKAIGREQLTCANLLWENLGNLVPTRYDYPTCHTHMYEWVVRTKQTDVVQDDLSTVAKLWETSVRTKIPQQNCLSHPAFVTSTSLVDAEKVHAEAVAKCKATAKEDARHK